jgi:hypothetical protein
MTLSIVLDALRDGKLSYRISDEGYSYLIFNGRNLESGTYVTDDEDFPEIGTAYVVKRLIDANESVTQPMFECFSWILTIDDLMATDWQIIPFDIDNVQPYILTRPEDHNE